MTSEIGRYSKGFASFARGAWGLYRTLEQSKQDRRADEQHARVMESLEESRRVQQFIENPVASDKLGAGRLGTLADARAEGMLDPNGLFIGALEGQPLFYSGDDHLLNYALTRSGKGRDIVLPNLAHVFNRSLVVNDIKDGENAYASAEYRRSQGHKIIAINPHGLLDAPSFRLNPFQRLIDKAQAGESITEDSLQLCMSLVPPDKGENKWVAAGAQQILATWLEWSARFRPDKCTLSNMWRFIFRDLDEHLEAISRCGIDGLEGQADKMLGIKNSADQWNAYESDLTTALWNFRPDTPLAAVTESSNFNPADMRHEKTTLYLMANSDLLEASSRWVSLTISAIVNTCAQTSGPVPVTFIIDELANLPYMAIISKSLTLYAGKGVQLWGLCQGREALLDKGYSDHTIKNFETQSGLLHMWSIKETDLLQDIEKWSGNMAVAVRGTTQGGGQVSSASFGIQEQKRPVLQSEDIMAVGEGKQLIRTNGAHLYIADRVPWFKVPRWADKLKDVREMGSTVKKKPVQQVGHEPVRKLPPPE
jgi:type IV secretion system protein VirD4